MGGRVGAGVVLLLLGVSTGSAAEPPKASADPYAELFGGSQAGAPAAKPASGGAATKAKGQAQPPQTKVVRPAKLRVPVSVTPATARQALAKPPDELHLSNCASGRHALAGP